MKIREVSFILYILLKPYYFFESGSLQIGDIFLLISFALWVFEGKSLKNTLDNKDKLFLYFVLFIIIINTIYGLFFKKLDFHVSTLHYIFNFLLIILIRHYSNNELFLNKLFSVIRISLWVQLIIYLTGFGRFYLGFTDRYMGTFNDPNQMAFYIYGSLLVMYLISKIINARLHYIDYVVSVFLIITTSSTGMFLGVSIFLLLVAIKMSNSFTTKKVIFKKFIFSYLLIILVFIIILLNYYNVFDISNVVSLDNLQNRIEEKITKFTNQDSSSKYYSDLSFIEERGIDKLKHYPQNILWGAGQGFNRRFEKAAHHGEVHSTLPSILFYYGLLPFILIIIWMIKNTNRLDSNTFPIFVSLFIESFTLLNQRQPFFWMLFVLADVYYNKKVIKQNSKPIIKGDYSSYENKNNVF